MKKYLLGLALMALLASPSFAYVQSGQLLGNTGSKSENANRSSRLPDWIETHGPIGGAVPSPGAPAFDPYGEAPSRPIPEPGTMALASLGLLALGVSRARRRGH
jgi:hypothetical protein